MVTTKRTYTLTDLLALPDDGQIYEVLGGELVVWNAPDSNHSLVVAELTSFLMLAQDAGYGLVFPGPHAVAFDFVSKGWAAEDVTHPDLYFLRLEREDLVAQRVLQGVPDLVIEIISPSNRERDVVEKLNIHQRNGVPYYWIVDPPARAIRQYTLLGEPFVAGRYGEPTLLRPGDKLTSPLFPEVSVAVSRVFRNVRERRP